MKHRVMATVIALVMLAAMASAPILARAADQPGHGQADHRQHLGARVAERMFDDHRRWMQALGACGAHVVLVQHVEHAGAGEADNQRRVRYADGDGGQHEIAQSFEQANDDLYAIDLGPGSPARLWKWIELRGPQQ